jgi:hypothetical protein
VKVILRRVVIAIIVLEIITLASLIAKIAYESAAPAIESIAPGWYSHRPGRP